MKIKGLCLASLLLFGLGCGVKSPPLPSTQVAPKPVADLKAESVAEGIEISFKVPRADKPAQQIVQARLYYGYLPLTGEPECPPCPPRLRKYHEFNFAGKAAVLMEGGIFTYLDTAAPMETEAFYQVQLKDAAGRVGPPSLLASVPRKKPLPSPTGLSTWAEENAVTVAWEGKSLEGVRDEKDGLAGYFVFRKGPDDPEKGKQLNFAPLKTPRLVDKTVERGKTYFYRVAAVERFKKRLIKGELTPWKPAKPYDATAPKPPTDLMAVSQPDGIYLRFTPSPDLDTAGYLIFRSQAKKGPWAPLNKEPVKTNTYVDTSVKPMALYFYQVKAVDESGNQSPASDATEIRHQP